MGGDFPVDYRLLDGSKCRIAARLNYHQLAKAADDMKLLTHNMLACHIKGHTENMPFTIEASKTQEVEADYDPSFLRHIFPRIEWATLRSAAEVMGAGGLPEAVEPAMLEDDQFLRSFHHALLEVQLLEGALVCPETGRKFPVNKGIPNLLLNEDEC